MRRGDRLPAQAAQRASWRAAAGLEIGTTGGDHGRRAHAHLARRRVGGGRRRRGAARALDAADPRPHRLARLRAGPHGGVRRAGQDLEYDPVWIPWGMVAGDYTIGGFSIGETLATAMGVPVRRRQGRRRLARPLLPGRHPHARQAAGRAGHAEDHRRPDPRRRGRQGALRTSSPSRPSAARRWTTWPGWRTSTRRRSARCSSRSRSPPRTASRRCAAAGGRAGMSGSRTPSGACASAPSTTCSRTPRRRLGKGVPGTVKPYQRPRGPVWRLAVRAALPARALAGQEGGDGARCR